MSVSDFANIARTNSDTLRYYDNIGLLSPAVRGENKYRYYSLKQLPLCNMGYIQGRGGQILHRQRRILSCGRLHPVLV